MMAPMLLKIIMAAPKDIGSMEEFADESSVGGGGGSKDICRFGDELQRKYRQRVADLLSDAFEYGWIRE